MVALFLDANDGYNQHLSILGSKMSACDCGPATRVGQSTQYPTPFNMLDLLSPLIVFNSTD